VKTLIFSYLYRRPGCTDEACNALGTLLHRWYDHLRGPGLYAGDVVVFSNVRIIARPGLLVRPFDDVPADPRRAFMHRILSYDRVPLDQYDVAMQMDLDVLAVKDVNRLFPHDERLWAAPSDLPMMEWRQAWTLLPKWRRGLHKLTGWRMHDPGASACVAASATQAWERNFGTWARLIRAHGNRPAPHWADQSFLNLLLLERTVPIARWPRELIVHREWDDAPGACLLHFPGTRKQQMASYQKV
jgi:hypothetical protein